MVKILIYFLALFAEPHPPNAPSHFSTFFLTSPHQVKGLCEMGKSVQLFDICGSLSDVVNDTLLVCIDKYFGQVYTY